MMSPRTGVKKLRQIFSIAAIRRSCFSVPAAAVALLCWPYSIPALAGGEVTDIVTIETPNSPFKYTVNGETYHWGIGSDQVLQSFTAEGVQFSAQSYADRVLIQRVDIPGLASGKPCAVFAERDADFSKIKTSFPGDGSDQGNCDMERMLKGRVINRGALNVFSNVGPDSKNIERVDFIFKNGLITPLSADLLALTGHLASEKRGNNEIQMAAIRQIGKNGEPTEFGPLLKIGAVGCGSNDVCYGETPVTHNYSFFKSNAVEPHGAPAHFFDSTETVAMAFVSLERLGLSTDETYYGFSYFPIDVDPALHVLTDPSTFPQDTADTTYPGDGADIYGGMSGLYVAQNLPPSAGSVITASVFIDSNGNGIKDPDEPGVEAIGLTLYQDTNQDGIFDPAQDAPVGDSADTNNAGTVSFIGVPDGMHFVVIDVDDPDLPPGIELPGGSEVVTVVSPLPPGDTVNFVFTDMTDGTPGDGTPGDGTPGDGTPGDGTPGDGTPGDGTPGDGTPGDGTPGDGTPGDGTPGDGTPGDGTPGDGTPGDPLVPPLEIPGPAGDGTPPVAVDDTATANQNMSVLINVLANDSDPAQGGLTIVSVSAVENGEANVVNDPQGNQQIEFTPALGFLGTTAFTYTIEDINGVQDSGSVVVEVIRFSDINDDGINDFDQCDGCTNLQLITGVHGSGLGSLNITTLIVLSVVSLALRQRRKIRTSK